MSENSKYFGGFGLGMIAAGVGQLLIKYSVSGLEIILATFVIGGGLLIYGILLKQMEVKYGD